MKRQLLLLCTLLLALPLPAQEHLSALLPYPNHIETLSHTLTLSAEEAAVYDSEELEFAFRTLQSSLRERMDITLRRADKGRISLKINPDIAHREGYRIDIGRRGILIEGQTAAGIFYGVRTLDQLLMGDPLGARHRTLRAVRIDDAPALEVRALMLDPARHFLPVEGIRRYIDEMSRYKYNRLQLHLTDDQGWRLEIKSHPELTRHGAFRSDTGTPADDRQYYTQEEIRALTAYAAQRHVEIIPEIDIPGHTGALLTVFPELRCDFLRDSLFTGGKTFNVMLSAANPAVYTLLDDIIGEVAQLFPSRTLHLGGDESAIAANWARSDEHRTLMAQQGFTRPEQIMGYFFDRVLASTRRHGVHAILWCELDNIYPPATDYLFAYPQDVTLVTWRNGLTPKCIELTRRYGNDLLLAPGEYAYFDYPQYDNDLPETGNWGMPQTTLEKCYSLDPTYGLPPSQRGHISGVMGTLWGEAIRDIHRAFYMTYPRALALGEAGWTHGEQRDWESFRRRMYPHLAEMMQRGIPFRVPFEVAE